MTNKMNSERKTAIIVGVLFIIGTVSGITAGALTAPIRAGSTYPLNVSASETQWIIGYLFALLMALSLSMVPVLHLSPDIGVGIGLLLVPTAIQEMVFAVWLITKGFNPSAVAFEPAKM